jgi:uncharacterized protein YcnI
MRPLLAVCLFLLLAPSAFAHAHVSPSVVQRGHSETFTVVVPTEGDANTSEVEVTVPDGFQVGSFEAAPGWKRSVEAAGSGDEAIVSKVTWTGGKVPEGEAAYLRFQGEAEKAGDYTFKVRQTYDDGKVEDWSQGPDSETPAPVVTVEAASASGDGTDALTVVALILGGIGLLLGGAAFLRGGGRSLT